MLRSLAPRHDSSPLEAYKEGAASYEGDEEEGCALSPASWGGVSELLFMEEDWGWGVGGEAGEERREGTDRGEIGTGEDGELRKHRGGWRTRRWKASLWP